MVEIEVVYKKLWACSRPAGGCVVNLSMVVGPQSQKMNLEVTAVPIVPLLNAFLLCSRLSGELLQQLITKRFDLNAWLVLILRT